MTFLSPVSTADSQGPLSNLPSMDSVSLKVAMVSFLQFHIMVVIL